MQNVNRWRDQVKLPETSEKELLASATKITVDGTEGLFVELVGPESVEKRETILGALVVRGDKVWFFKLRGDVALAAREKGAFESFIRSVKFSQE